MGKAVTILILFFAVITAGIVTVFVMTTKDSPNSQGAVTLNVQEEEKQTTQKVSAWIAWWDETSALESLNVSKEKLHSISPVWYVVTKDGGVQETAAKKRNEIASIASQNNIELIPTISNATETGFDPLRLSYIFESDARTNSFVSLLTQIAIDNNYSGWNIDFEEVAENDKERFSQFIQKLSTSLKKENKQTTVALHAKTGKRTDWKGARGQDWQAISEHADFVQIMAYDFHSSSSAPGPITPIDKYQETLEYALQNIPSEKIVIGLPAYGYDWGPNDTESITYETAETTASKQGVTPEQDSDSLHKTYTYEGSDGLHTVWYTDYRSLQKLKQIAYSQGISSFALWRLGSEDTSFWEQSN